MIICNTHIFILFILVVLACSVEKFLGQLLNPSHSRDNTKSLTARPPRNSYFNISIFIYPERPFYQAKITSPSKTESASPSPFQPPCSCGTNIRKSFHPRPSQTWMGSQRLEEVGALQSQPGGPAPSVRFQSPSPSSCLESRV